MKKKNTAFLIMIMLQTCLLIVDPLIVQAGIFGSGGSVSGKIRKGINSFLEEDLNINVEDALKPITETLNSSDRKGETPRVSIRFSTPNPKPGEEITAIAEVDGVANRDDAYYVWYLKRKEHEECDNPYRPDPCHGPEGTPGILHEVAVAAQVSMYFDPETMDQKFNNMDSLNQAQKDLRVDNDGDHDFPIGGISSGSEPKYGYVYHTETGKQYEIRDKNSDISSQESGCEEGYVARCMIEDNTLQCPVDVPPIEGSTSSETTSETSSGDTTTNSEASTSISGGGGPRAEVRMRCLDEGAARCDAGSNTLQCESAAAGGWFDCSGGSAECDTGQAYATKDACETKSGSGNCDFRADLSADTQTYSYSNISIPTPMCVKIQEDGSIWEDPNVTGCATTENESGGGGDNRPYFRFSDKGDGFCGGAGGTCTVTITANGTTETKTFTNPGIPPDGGATPQGSPYRYEDSDGFIWKSVGESSHKLAIILNSDYPDGTEVCVDGECHEMSGRLGGGGGSSADGIHGASCLERDPNVKVPNGSCQIREIDDNTMSKSEHRLFNVLDLQDMSEDTEIKYGLNPYDDRTTPLAANDAELIAGVGQREFTWKYEEGDEVTVVVEGEGVETTKHEDASSQIVYAMVGKGCDMRLDAPEAKIDSYEEMVKGKVMKIDSAVIAPSDCIDSWSFVEPGTSEYDSLDVSLSTGVSQSGAAIASGVGQPMHIVSMAGQKQGGSISPSKKLYYEWSVTCGEDDLDITDQLNIPIQQGMNVPALDFIADFPDQCFGEDSEADIKVTAKINEPRAGGGSNFGKNTTTFTAYKTEENPLKTFKTQASGSSYTITDEEICAEGIDRTICRVMPHEVIAITVPDDIEDGMVSWQVNGKDYVCDNSVSPSCVNAENMATRTIVVPVEGSDGDMMTISAYTNTVDVDTNQAGQFMRTFRITEPGVMIEPVAGAQKKSLGTYTDLDGETFDDQSSKVFTTASGETVSLAANLYPAFLNTQEEGLLYAWTLNGEKYSTEKSIQFVPEGNVHVGLSVKKIVDQEDRKALQDAFSVMQKSSTSQTYNTSVQIRIDESSLAQHTGITGFFASVSHNTPFYMLFLLKMVFMISLMLFVPSLVLGMGKPE